MFNKLADHFDNVCNKNSNKICIVDGEKKLLLLNLMSYQIRIKII